MKMKACETCGGGGVVLEVSAQELKDARIGAGLSQAKLGARLGITGPYVSDLENGNRGGGNPRLVRLWIEVCEAAKGAAA